MHVPLSLMHLMDLLQLKSWPWGLLFDSFRCINLGPGADVDESTGSKVLALGADFKFIRLTLRIRCTRLGGPGGAWGGGTWI